MSGTWTVNGIRPSTVQEVLGPFDHFSKQVLNRYIYRPNSIRNLSPTPRTAADATHFLEQNLGKIDSDFSVFQNFYDANTVSEELKHFYYDITPRVFGEVHHLLRYSANIP